MRISIVTPAAASSRTGNRHTAARYARFLRTAGHQVKVSVDWLPQPTDLLIALHARKSRPAMLAYRSTFPERPLVLILTGTDLYRDIRADEGARASLDEASRLVVLQEAGLRELSALHRRKTDVVFQSSATRLRRNSVQGRFRIAVLGHLRDEKDPFRAAYALRRLNSPALEVVHVGDALTRDTRVEARRLMAAESRYRWIGGRPHANALRWLSTSHLLVVSSVMEGGANVICEAARIGVPVLGSRIPGNIGMLGTTYPGYYPFGDEQALAGLIDRAQRDPDYYRALERGVALRRSLFAPAAERRGVRRAVQAAIQSVSSTVTRRLGTSEALARAASAKAEANRGKAASM